MHLHRLFQNADIHVNAFISSIVARFPSLIPSARPSTRISKPSSSTCISAAPPPGSRNPSFSWILQTYGLPPALPPSDPQPSFYYLNRRSAGQNSHQVAHRNPYLFSFHLHLSFSFRLYDSLLYFYNIAKRDRSLPAIPFLNCMQIFKQL